MQATLETFRKADGSKDGKRWLWHPCQDPLLFAHVQTVQECESPISLRWQETCVLTCWLWCRQRGACQPESVLRVSQPYLRQKDDTGEGETAAVQAQISAGFLLLPKFLVADGQMLVLIDWWVWFTGARGFIPWWEARRGSHVELVSCGSCSLGWFGCVKAALLLSSSPLLGVLRMHRAYHTPALQPPPLPVRQHVLKARVIPSVLS